MLDVLRLSLFYLSIKGLFTIESTMQEYFNLCTRVF